MLEVFLRQNKTQNNTTMSNSIENGKNEIFDYVVGILAFCGVTGWSLYYLFSLSPFFAWAACIIFLAGIVFASIWFAGAKSKESLENSICKQLDKQGFRHEKQDGTLYVIKNDNQFRIYIGDSFDRRIKHLYFLYDFGDDNFGKVSMAGWTRAANSINANNTHTAFVVLDDHFCCCYQTAIANARDFMKEFDYAYRVIGGALEDYNRIYPHIERDFPNNTSENKSSIGFR